VESLNAGLNINKNIVTGRVLRQLRKDAGLTQEQLALGP
jgi:DNA-binding XRE family transcriptional regulator